MIVPWQDIADDTLQRLLEEFVTRDGTDYGEREMAVATRVDQVRDGLRRKLLVIWFNEETEEISILPRDHVKSAQGEWSAEDGMI